MKKVYPFEARLTLEGKEGKALLDQISAVDKKRLGKKIASLDRTTMEEVDRALKIVLSLNDR